MDPLSLIAMLATAAAMARQKSYQDERCDEVTDAWARLLNEIDGPVPEDLAVIADKMMEECREPPQHYWSSNGKLLPLPKMRDDIDLDVQPPRYVEVFFEAPGAFQVGDGTWMAERMEDSLDDLFDLETANLLRDGAYVDDLVDDGEITEEQGREIEALMEGARQEHSGWYWWHSMPGCLPDSDAYGPFVSRLAATQDAWENSGSLQEFYEDNIDLEDSIGVVQLTARHLDPNSDRGRFNLFYKQCKHWVDPLYRAKLLEVGLQPGGRLNAQEQELERRAREELAGWYLLFGPDGDRRPVGPFDTEIEAITLYKEHLDEQR